MSAEGNGMAEKIVIVGSGPSAAGVALALVGRGHDITVLDLGSELEADQQGVVDVLASQPASEWDPVEVARISQQPVAASRNSLPQKRSYGSDYPFRDLGQLHGMRFRSGANSSPISGAYGGFSNVWGAQVMPFSRATFDTWPVDYDDLARSYTAVLEEVPLAAEIDDLAEIFPLLTDKARPLPPLSERSRRVLAAYDRHRARLNAGGTTVGRARLALQAPECVRCGLCMTGCPYGLIYSAAQTFDRLRKQKLVRYRGGCLVTRVGEDAAGGYLVVQDLASSTSETVRADRIFVGAGGIGSTRLALGSMAKPPATLHLAESLQFAVPFLSRRSTGDPRRQSDFTLNQFNILLDFDDEHYSTSHIHCYPYNPSVLGALPGPLTAMDGLAGQFLGRLTIGLGYLPSWASPSITLSVTPRSNELPGLTMGNLEPDSTPLLMGQVLRRLRKIARPLDLYAIEPQIQLAASGKSYHFGGSFPHRRKPNANAPGTDVFGRIPGWRRIHLVDGAVLPSVPSTTFTLTVMANAHRIARSALGIAG